MTRRAWLPFLVAFAVAGPLPVASAAPAPTVLKGTVKITSSYSGVVDVRLPKPVDFGYTWPPKGTSVSGAGRLYGAVLVDAAGKAPSLEALVYGFCATEGCTGPGSALKYEIVSGTGPSRHVLPAGDYRLLLVTDGKPVTVVLTLPGLSGSQTLRLPKRLNVRHLTTAYLGAVPATPGSVAYEGASDGDVDGGLGLLFHQFAVQTDESVQQNVGFCLYTAPLLGDPAPGCPAGSGIEASLTSVRMSPGGLHMWGHVRFLGEGGYRAGVYYNALGVAHDPVGVVTYVTLPPR